ncbi:MAG: hypothetical protein HC875_15740 [Anaerolineales bacterium]|nr:hypothetical protein [Anaerolineales bacterium]
MAEINVNRDTVTLPAQRAGLTRTIGKILKRNDMSVVIATALLFLIFALATDSFFTAYNLFNISRTAGLYVFVALGQMIVVVIGGMNLSLGAIGGLSVIAAGYTMDTLGWPPSVSVPIALLVGLSAGAFNGFIIIKSKINSFIITLASLFIFTGLVTGISQGFPYTNIPKSFTMLGREAILVCPTCFCWPC